MIKKNHYHIGKIKIGLKSLKVFYYYSRVPSLYFCSKALLSLR